MILLASGESSMLLEQALEADVADVLLLPQMTENVVFAIRKSGHSGRRSTAPGARRGRIVTVFSPKGGTGKTVIATNTAASVAKYEGRRRSCSTSTSSSATPRSCWGSSPSDLRPGRRPGELDTEKLAGYVTRHASGLDILPALREDAELVTEAKLGQLLEVAKQSYDVIVVDTSPFFHGPMLATLDRTDELLLVCSLDVPTLKNVRLALRAARAPVVPDRASSSCCRSARTGRSG